MSIRIGRISVVRSGPLKKDFSLLPGGLNLIYGHNETGKTYILETMISLLFRTGPNTPWTNRWTKSRSATMRKWDPVGEIEITGLEEGTTLFSPGNPSLDDLTEDVDGLPRELSRLMVVRAGDTRLSDDRDGVGDEVLRTYLSGNRVLDYVEGNIEQETVKNAVIIEGRIESDRKGLYKERLALEHQMEYLDELQLVVEDTASLEAMNVLEKRKKNLEERLAGLEDARRHRAFQVSETIEKLKLDIDDLPSEEELIRLITDISILRTREREVEEIRRRMEESAGLKEDLDWIESAREEYLHGAGGGTSSMERILTVILVLSLVLSASGAFISRILTISGAVAAAASFLLLRHFGDGDAGGGMRERMDEIRLEFQRRFGRSLTDTATLKMVLDDLESENSRQRNLAQRQQELQNELGELRRRIDAGFYSFEGEEVSPANWDEALTGIKSMRKKLQDRLVEERGILSSLNVQPDSYLYQSPGGQWDQKCWLDLRDQLSGVEEDLERERRSLEKLKFDISSAANTNSRDMRKLLTALADKRSEVAEAHREVTARILAGNCVYRAVSEYRNQENARLVDALGSPEVINTLYRITGRYNGIRMDEAGYLHLRINGKGEYPLSRLSTGASEQVYIALRMGFASITLGEPAFLILDDAFQHSDWNRRKNLVAHAIEMVRCGWQIFYFTMDDHICKLFEGMGRELGDNLYQRINLE